MDPALHTAFAVALALLFLGAARHKWREGDRFRAVLAEYRLLPSVLAPIAARVLMATELVVGMLLLLPSRRAQAALAGALLLALYAVAIGVNLGRGRTTIDCGCGGTAHGLSIWMISRNLAVAAIACALSTLPVAARPLHWADGLAATLGVVGLALAWLLLDQLLGNHIQLRTWRAARSG